MHQAVRKIIKIHQVAKNFKHTNDKVTFLVDV